MAGSANTFTSLQPMMKEVYSKGKNSQTKDDYTFKKLKKILREKKNTKKT